MTRSVILTAGAPGAHLEVSDVELDALAVAIGNAVGTPAEYPLVNLLRKLDPDHRLLATIDRISREHGYASDGADVGGPGYGAEVQP